MNNIGYEFSGVAKYMYVMNKKVNVYPVYKLLFDNNLDMNRFFKQ